jgi:beta-lactamase regulating signal transducer with metallopeptidase domain
VAISRGLLEGLSAKELRATLEHEGYHVRNLDPLRAAIGAVLSEALFRLPLLVVLRERYEAARELAADRRAAEACGPRPIAGALLKALEGRQWADPSVSASLGGGDLLRLRLSQLETGRAPRLAAPDPAGLARSALGVGALAALFAAALAGLGGPAAPAHVAAIELRPATMLEGAALCVGPVLLAAGSAFRILSRAATRPLT